MTTTRPSADLPATAPPWTDATLTPDHRVELLLAEMTLEEKLGQLGSAWKNSNVTGINVAPQQDVFTRTETYDAVRQHGLGHLTRPFGTSPQEPAAAARKVTALQQDLLDNTRLQVPAIVHEECLTGFTTYRATVYPTPLAWAATFNPDLIESMAAAIGADMRAGGVHQGLSPVLDVVRDHRWGRVEETLGEDPYLIGTLASAYVRGLQGSGVLATLKHFAGYSASQAARNHAPVHMGIRELRDIILVPFEMAVRDGAASVMNSYSEIDGQPVAASTFLLTDVLRGEWDFQGTVVSDYWAVAFLESMHRVAATTGDAGALALAAGLDIELPDTRAYGEPLAQLIRAGAVPLELVDRSVRYVLRQKLGLGLLDADWSPVPPADPDSLDFDSPHNRGIARQLAEQSIVLLANPSSVLPLADTAGDIALIGPCAADVNTFFGCYSFPNHVLHSYPELGNGIAATSLHDALVAEFPRATVTHQPGCEVTGSDTTGIAEASAAAAAASLAIVAVGDRSGLFGRGTSGEGCDVPDLSLPGVQDQLLEAVLATGTPTILIVVSGRPYALGAYKDRAAAIIQSFFPGEEGGPSIAGVLSGRVTPTGKLPVQIPNLVGVNPSTYLHPPLAGPSDSITNLNPTPAFPFGHGLSYTQFEYTDLVASTGQIDTNGELSLQFSLTNTGTRAGSETVQLYFNDPVAQVTRPTTQLLGFARVELDPGQTAIVNFDVHTDRFAFTGIELTRIVEPGQLELYIGSSSTDIRLQTNLTVTGNQRAVSEPRILRTPVNIEYGG
jgi:beta-xylosidase